MPFKQLPVFSTLLLAMTLASMAGEAGMWSIQPLGPVARPLIPDSAWDRNPIDTFVRAEHRRKGLEPATPADPSSLLRRLHLDLLGIPPSLDALQQLREQSSSTQHELWVDRLLASPAYGERWGRLWLDVARFAESSGFEHDSDRPHAFPYRDFVIQAFNDNLPYNIFVQWQIAGDQIASDRALAHAATGFLGAGVFPTQLTEKEFESARYDELDDMVSATGSAFLGLSVGCARCHDHKFDPIPAADYYALASTFTRTIRTEVDLQLDNGQRIKAMVNTEGKPPLKHAADGRGYPHFYKTTYFLKRGDISQKTDPIQPGFLTLLAPKERPMLPSGNRVRLARWLTDPRQGAGRLAARVMVNRLWQHHFGVGLVSTPNDFGTQGSRPTHPALLDWLAHELIQRDWNLKAIQRLIVTSNTYRQGSDYRDQAARTDKTNRYLWRFPPRRLDAEAIRDSMLSVSGLLDDTPYGPGSLDPDMRRRSIYFFIKRSQPVPFLLLFDFPERLVSIGRRATTNIAPQGLALMNSPVIRHYASGLADRAQSLVERGTEENVISSLYRLALARFPSDEEWENATRYLNGPTASLAQAPRPMMLIDLAHSLLMSNEFLYLR